MGFEAGRVTNALEGDDRVGPLRHSMLPEPFGERAPNEGIAGLPGPFGGVVELRGQLLVEVDAECHYTNMLGYVRRESDLNSGLIGRGTVSLSATNPVSKTW